MIFKNQIIFEKYRHFKKEIYLGKFFEK